MEIIIPYFQDIAHQQYEHIGSDFFILQRTIQRTF